MALLNFTAAARAAGVNRSTIVRAVKTGRVSTTTNEANERCIDTAELMRVFGPLKTHAQADIPTLPRHAIGSDALLERLQAQLQEAKEREIRLWAMLENEQQARRELEQKLLPPPAMPATPLGGGSGSRRSGTRRDRTTTSWWALVGLLLVAMGAAVWYFRDTLLDRLLASLGG